MHLKNVWYAHFLIYQNFFAYKNIELDIGLPPGHLPDIHPDCEDTSGMPSIPPPKNYRQLYRRHMDKIQESTPPTPDATKKIVHQGLWTPPPDLLPQPILPAVDSKFEISY